MKNLAAELAVPSCRNLIVWCSEGQAPINCNQDIIFWSKYVAENKKNEYSITQLLENSEAKFKARYLSIIHRLGETEIDDISIIKRLTMSSGYSFWWSTLVAEQHNGDELSQVDDCIKLLVFEEWLQDKDYQEIKIVGARHSLVQSITLLCQKLQFKWSQKTVERKTKTISSGLPGLFLLRIFRTVIGCTINVIKRLPLRGVGLSLWCGSKSDVVFTSYSANLNAKSARSGIFESKYWSILPEKLKRTGVRLTFLHLYMSDSLSPSPRSFAQKIKAFNSNGLGMENHASLDTFMNLKVFLNVVSDWLQFLKSGVLFRRKFSEKAGFLWPLIKVDYERSFFGASGFNNIKYFHLARHGLSLLAGNPQGFYLQENQCWEYGFIHAWKIAGHRRISGVVHVPISYWDLSFFRDHQTYTAGAMPIPDYSLVNNSSSYQLLKEGNSPNRILQVEALRYLHLSQTSSGRGNNKIESQRIGGKQKLMVFCDIQKSKVIDMFKLLKDISHEFSDEYSLVIKFHPACQLKEFDVGLFCSEVFEGTIEDALQIARLVFTSNATSAALDAYCSGLKVISMRDASRLNLSKLKGNSDVTFIGNSSELFACLQKNNKPSTLSESVEYFFIDVELPRWKKFICPRSPA